jgi:very-short-patch-repair endonuclease
MQQLSTRPPTTIIFKINKPFHDHWEASGVKDAYFELVNEKINQLVKNLNAYDPYSVTLRDYEESIQMLSFTTTELIAQFCAGGFRWMSTDKARFLSPIVDVESIIRNRALSARGIGSYFTSVKTGVWEFLAVSEDTKSWIESQNLNKKQTAYLLWAAKHGLNLLGANERIPGYSDLALDNNEILDGYTQAESPIESILYMQLVVDGLRPPKLKSQVQIGDYRVDLAIPDSFIAIECDGEKYHNSIADVERDRNIRKQGWSILRFSAKDIMMDPTYCSERIHDEYPWRIINAKQE